MCDLKNIGKRKRGCVERVDEVIPQLPIGQGNKPLKQQKGGKQ